MKKYEDLLNIPTTSGKFPLYTKDLTLISK